MAFTFRERFIGTSNSINGGLYAPLTLGAPQYTNSVDYKIFKKDKEEKLKTQIAKAKHKQLMLKTYGKGNIGKRLNASYFD